MVYLPYKPGCCSRQTVSSLARLGLPQQTAQPRVDCPPPCRQVLQTSRQRPSMLTYNLTDSHLRESWKYQRDLSCRPGQVSLSVFHVCRKISVCNSRLLHSCFNKTKIVYPHKQFVSSGLPTRNCVQQRPHQNSLAMWASYLF